MAVQTANTPYQLQVANTQVVNATANTAAVQPTNPFRQAILQHFQTLQTPTTADAPAIKAQTDAFNITAARGLEDTRRTLAEQAYAQGQLGSGGYNALQQQAVERAAADRARFVGDAVADAEARRQSQLMQALGLGAQFEMQDADLAQRESQFGRTLAQQDDHFTRNLSQQEAQFGRDLAQRDEHFRAQLEQSAKQFAEELGFNYAQLKQQDRQFLNDLAWQKELAKMQDETARRQISASSGAASARLAFERERALEDDRRWSLYNTPDVIDAANRRAILEALGVA